MEDKPAVGTGVFRAKLMLEILAVYDIFGLCFPLGIRTHVVDVLLACLSTGNEPTLLATNTSSWW